jgi:cation transport ATPase
MLLAVLFGLLHPLLAASLMLFRSLFVAGSPLRPAVGTKETSELP